MHSYPIGRGVTVSASPGFVGFRKHAVNPRALTRVIRYFIASAILLWLSSIVSAAVVVQEFYLPIPEPQLYTAENTIQPGSGSTQNSIYSIVVTGNGTQIIYDQWEDGYEVDLNHPTQASTQVWGDGNDANGIPPGFAHDPVGLPAGTVITLTNQVPLPRNPSVLLYDGRDRIGGTKALVISHAGWPVAQGPVFAGSASVLSTLDYGTNYICPVGNDITNKLFGYCGLFVMAAQDNTSVTIDPDGAGAVVATNIVLNRGESFLYNNGIKKGASVTSSKPVQAHLVIGHISGSYAADWFTLFPVQEWSDTYYTPVASASSSTQPAYVYLFNANNTNITVNYQTLSGSGSFTVPASNGVFQFTMPKGSGAGFTSVGGAKYYALCTVAANNTADTAYNWGFALLPKTALTTEADVGWAPGSSDGTVNGSPVWVTALGATRLYVDYKGDHSGPLTDPNGNKYDTNFDVTALQSKKIFDPSKDQTGMRIYTLNGTVISAVWGEDPDTAAPGNPYIDAGAVVLPFPVPTLIKSSTIVTDTAPTGLSVNDVIQYTVELDNRGLLPLGNTVVFDNSSTNLAYVSNSTTLNGVAIPDDAVGTPFPLDAPGYTIPIILSGGTSTFQYEMKVTAAGQVTNSVNVGGTTLFSQTTITPGTNSCTVNFTDGAGAPVSSYSAGSNIFVTITDPGANSSSNSVDTITIVVKDTTSGDYESVTLTETGVNTGVFRNTAGLPTSLAAGVNPQDGTLHVAGGDNLAVDYTNPLFGNSCSAAATILIPSFNKVLYLSVNGAGNGVQDLTRVDPVAAAHGPSHPSADIGFVTSGTATLGLASTTYSTSGSGTAAALSVPHVTGSGPNRLMMVGVSYGLSPNLPTGSSVTNLTYGGQSLTFLASSEDPSATKHSHTEIWYLKNPASGSNNVVVGISTNVNLVVGISTFTNANQLTTFGTAGTASANNSKNVSVTVSSATGEIVFAAMGCDDDGSTLTITSGAGQTDLWQTNSANQAVGTATIAAGAASVASTWAINQKQQWAAAAVPIKPAAIATGGTNATTFLQVPGFCSAFTIPSNTPIIITNYITITNGAVMPATPAVTATLATGSTNLITLTNAAYTSASSNIVWTGALSSNVTVPANLALSFVISNNEPGVTFHVDYDSTNKPSKIILPAGNVIHIGTLGVYDAPYPGGNLVTAPVAGTTLYVRTVVADPFGSYDISSIDLSIIAPAGGQNIATNLASAVASDACSKTYEYVWQTGATAGGYNLTATAHEGTEGITDVAGTTVSLIFLDLGTPSTSEFTSGNNGPATNSFGANSTVCVRVNDPDQNANSSVAETLSAVVTSSSGDSEVIVMTETGTNSGVFTACITTSTNSGAGTNNGILLAPVGSLLTLTYTDPNDSSDTSSASATIQPPPGVPGVLASKTLITPANGQAVVGDTVQFNLQIVNSGSTVLSSLSITDAFPSGQLSFTSATLPPDVTTASVVAWTNLGAFNPGQSTNIQVSFTATGAGAASNNLAAASGATTGNSFAIVSNSQPALTVTKTLLSPTNSPVSITSNVVFRIIVRNTGTTVVPTLPMEDNFSGAYLQYVSATIPPDGSGSGSLIWTNLASTPLAVGASITNDVTMLVKGAGNPALNSAVVDFAVDANGKPVPASTGTATNLITAAATIDGTVYNDADQSGTLTVGDAGLAGVTLQLFTDPNGDGDPSDGSLVQIVTSDAAGAYEFPNLPTGKYVVVDTDLPGYSSSAPLNNRLPLNVASLATSNNNNFFQYRPSPAVYGSVSGTVWYDANGNGTNDTGETGITNGVTIDLLQDLNTNGVADAGEPIVSSTTTDGTGHYAFQNLTPGNYVVRETDLFGYYSTGDSVGTNDNQAGVIITNSAAFTNINFFDRFSPIATNDMASGPDHVAIPILPLVNDFSPNGDTLVITNASTTNGTVVINPGSTSLTYTATNIGSSTLTYTISDGHGGSSSAIITVSVTNSPPVANDDVAATSVNTPVTISPLLNDSDPNGDSLTILNVSGTNGTASIVNLTNVLFTPANNFSGTGTIGYTISDGNGGTASALITVNVFSAADVAISKSAPTNVYAGSTFDYVLSITNLGASSAAAISVTDDLPAGLVFVSATPAASTNGNQVVWTNLGSLAALTGTNLTINVTALPGVSSLTNIAVVSSTTADPNLTNNTTPPVITSVTPLADVAIGKSGPSTQVQPGGTISYTLSVTNFGPSTATSLTVTDNLPGNASFLSAIPLADIVTPTSVVWTNLGSLASGAITNLTLSVTAPLKGSVTNTASAGSSTADTNTANNVTPPVTATVSNVPPVAVDDIANTTRNVAVTVPVLANDSDANGDTLTIVAVASTNGNAAINGTNIVYTPSGNFAGTTYVSYTITDGQGGTNSASIAVTVVNRAPVANPQSVTNTEDTATLITLTASDLDSDSVTFAIVTAPTNGALSGLNPSTGTLTYTPGTNFNGTDAFTFRVNDGLSNSAPALVSITVTPVDDAPVANPQSVSTAEDTPKLITLTASDIENDPLTYSIVTGPTNGTLSGLNPTNGTVTYTPSTNFNGADAFTFRVNDGQSNSAPALVAITVNAVNDAPVATNLSITTPEDTATNITLSGTDVDSSNLVYAVLVGPTNGLVSGLDTNTGAITYTPGTNYNGPDAFTFTVSDGSLLSTGLVSITVTPVDDAPVANPQNVTVPENGVKGITLTASDVENDALTYSIVVGPTNGVLSGLNPTTGTITYTPGLNFNGADTFTFRANDGQSNSAPALVAITVTAVDQAPVANPQSVSTLEDTPKGITLTASDVENDPLTYSIVIGPTNGTLSGLNPSTGTLTYTPGTNFNGADAFTFRANDGQSNSAPALVSITVTPVDDAPVANPQSVTTAEDTPKLITLTASDVENDPLTYSIVTGPTNGTLSGLNPTNGTVTYTPSTNFNGADAFTFRANDGQSNSAPALVSITVTPVDDAPVATNLSITTPEDTATNIVLSGTDVDSSNLVYAVLVGPTNGSVSGLDTNTGAITYTPATNYNGPDAFTFTVSDGSLMSTGLVSITVTPVDDAPVANPQSVTTAEDTAKLITLTASDVENDALTYSIANGPTNGTLSGLNPTTGTVTYIPGTNFNGTDAFTFRANDGQSNSAPALISITVNPVNDAPVATNLSITTPEDTATNIVLSGTDVDSSNLVYAVLVGPTNGSVSGLDTNTGAITYRPGTNYNGPDGFTFTVSDGSLMSTGLVSITVTPVNDAPVANAEAYTLGKNVTLNVSAPGVLANDTDVDGDSLTAAKVTDPAHGALTLNPNGSFTYKPASNYFGGDSFTYQANDGTTNSVPATVTLTITNINYPPVLGNDTFTNLENIPFTLPFSVLLTNDYDPDGDPINVSSVQTNSGNGGKISVTSTNFTYKPPTNFIGTDSFFYVVSDGHGGNSTGTVFVVLAAPQFGLHATTNAFNPQTGLFESIVTVTNTGASTVPAVRLMVTNINSTNGTPKTNVYVYNASGTNAGVPYVQYNGPLDPGNIVTFHVEFYDADRRPFTNSYVAQAVLPAETGTNAASGVAVTREFMDIRSGTTRFVIEFPSTPGHVYTILYGPTVNGPWTAATPSITANATVTQWYDDGPPKTATPPLSVTNRFYQVLAAP